jgi:hypothetical protein
MGKVMAVRMVDGDDGGEEKMVWKRNCGKSKAVGKERRKERR